MSNTPREFRRKKSAVVGMRFTNNNEPDNKQMDDICLWINQGLTKHSAYHLWHNGTNIFIANSGGGVRVVEVGEWVLRFGNGDVSSIDDKSFNENYEAVNSA